MPQPPTPPPPKPPPPPPPPPPPENVPVDNPIALVGLAGSIGALAWVFRRRMKK